MPIIPDIPFPYQAATTSAHPRAIAMIAAGGLYLPSDEHQL